MAAENVQGCEGDVDLVMDRIRTNISAVTVKSRSHVRQATPLTPLIGRAGSTLNSTHWQLVGDHMIPWIIRDVGSISGFLFWTSCEY